MRRVMFAVAGLALCCAASSVWAQTSRPSLLSGNDMVLPPRRGATTQVTGANAQVGSNDILDTKRVALAMGIVLVTIFATHKVWKRLGMPGVGGKGSGSLQVVSRLNIAPKQQILLVRVGRRMVLVGNSGTQMNPLCEIADPEEAAGLLGQTVSEQSTFDTVLDTQEKQFDPESNVDKPAPADEDPAVASTREELNGLMDKVRSLSQQFRQA
jgi:flagellar biogenesis protein FliO